LSASASGVLLDDAIITPSHHTYYIALLFAFIHLKGYSELLLLSAKTLITLSYAKA
jgi:hypothetical protein